MPEKTAAPLAQLTPEAESLKARFGEAIQPAEYQGVVVSNDKLVEVAQAIRDDLGYDYLSSVTGVDYLDKGYLEVVYHAFSTAKGGGPLVFKARTPRDVAEVPSVTGLWRSADLQEREAYDMYGIRFTGHPDLRRVLTWEGLAGYPLRKDWKEAYYEQEHKPFDSRWPGGHHVAAEERAKYHDNTVYDPKEFNIEAFTPEAETLLYKGVVAVPGNGDGDGGMQTDSVVVNIGPQHPSTHGVFRMAVRLSGETVEELKPVMGYLHRNHEKIGERNTYIQNMPYTDRLDYICSMTNNFAYAITVEKLTGVKPPERAEYIRIIMAELTRVMNHLAFCGFLTNEMGAFFTPWIYAFEERELILDLFEAVSGSRIMCNYFRFGGVARDVSEDWLAKLKHLVYERLPRKTDEMEDLITGNEIVRSRSMGVAVLSKADAISLGASGPLLRASGVPYDVRKAEPYGIYDRFDFDTVTGQAGDVYDRYLVRIGEARQSIRILKQAIEQLPAGDIQASKKAYQMRVPAGQSYGRVEAPKGELGFYVVSDGSPNPYRYHVRATSFINLGCLATMARGGKLADAIIGLGSIDTTMGEVDR